MNKTEAERFVISEWRKLPLPDRKTSDQAALFAMKWQTKIDFPCKGDKYQTINAWLLRDLGRTRGMV